MYRALISLFRGHSWVTKNLMERKWLHRSGCVAAGLVSSLTRLTGLWYNILLLRAYTGFHGSVRELSATINPSVTRLRGRSAGCTYDNVKVSNKYVCRHYCCCDIIGTNLVVLFDREYFVLRSL